jgi:hypothetical protein
LAGGGTVTAADCKAAYIADTWIDQRDKWKERFDAALNTVGTDEQAAGVAVLRAIASEMEAWV